MMRGWCGWGRRGMSDELMLEREIQETLIERVPFAPPNHLLQSFEFNARRARRYPRWLALIKESPMRTNSRLAVGSPTVRAAAVLAATFLLMLALAAAGAGARILLAADGDIVVASRRFNYNNALHGAKIVAHDLHTGDTLWTAELPVAMRRAASRLWPRRPRRCGCGPVRHRRRTTGRLAGSPGLW